MIRRRIVSAGTRIQRADARMIRAKSRLVAAQIQAGLQAEVIKQAKQDQIQEARDFYEKKCLEREAAEIKWDEADDARDLASEKLSEACGAERRAHQALTKLEKENEQ